MTKQQQAFWHSLANGKLALLMDPYMMYKGSALLMVTDRQAASHRGVGLR